MSVLVWSYGSNLDPDRMRKRCPSAKMEGPLTFTNSALVFRAVADVVLRKDSVVPGGLWEISESDEAALDRYEGVSQGLYERWHLTKMHKGKERQILFYKMTETGIMPPSHHYIDTIMRGYRAFNLDLRYLEIALEESHQERNKTDYLRWRFKRDRPILAKPDHIQRILKPAPVVVPLQPEIPVFKAYGETRLIKAGERTIRNLDGTTRVITKSKRFRKRSAKLSRKGQ